MTGKASNKHEYRNKKVSGKGEGPLSIRMPDTFFGGIEFLIYSLLRALMN
jgi:hypothetical protein